MPAPSFAGFPEALRAELAFASLLLRTVKPIPPEAVVAATDHHFSALRHELSAHYLALRSPGSPADRTPVEARVLAALEAEGGALTGACATEFSDRLLSLNRNLAGGDGGWRTGDVKLADDRAGNQIYFPPVSGVPRQIERLRLFLADRGADPPLFTAAVACVLLLNCHPFTDGNGRTARVLFNHLLHCGGMPAHVYFPLYELARRSHGGYEIALRIAEIRGDWEPFVRFILNAIQCHREIAGHAAHRPATGVDARRTGPESPHV